MYICPCLFLVYDYHHTGMDVMLISSVAKDY